MVKVTDPIADFIIRIKNASMAGKDSTTVSYSKLKHAIAETLKNEGFIASIAKKDKKVGADLEIGLVTVAGKARVQGVERISHLSKRVYQGVSSIRQVRNGFGALILSTPKGILTDKQARKEKVGGEALFKIW